MKQFYPIFKPQAASLSESIVCKRTILTRAGLTGLFLLGLFVNTLSAAAFQPPTLVSFTAELNDRHVSLNWVMSSEGNISHFTIQRSENGRDFDDAGLIFTEGNKGTQQHYIFSEDIARLEDETGSAMSDAKDQKDILLYYRLKFVSLDGALQYSDIRVVRLCKLPPEKALRAFPNPTPGDLRVTIPASWQNSLVSYTIYNSSGRLVSRKSVSNAGETEAIHVASLPAGLYLIRAENGRQSDVQSFVKAN